MTFVESCIYYQDSKCILKGGCCDLDCGLTHSEKSNPFYDEIDTFTPLESPAACPRAKLSFYRGLQRG
jgi:hypothetical protein